MQPQAAPPPPPPPPPLPQVQVFPGPPGSPTEVLLGFRAQREELANQLEELEDRREDLSEQLQNPMVSGADRGGLEARVAELDQRIIATERAIQAADASVAQAAAVPGAVVPEPPPPREFIDEDIAAMGLFFLVVALLPLIIAYSRRIWRRGAVVTALPPELYDRLTRIEQSMDSVAIEVERIGEGQRFVTRVLSEGEPAAQPTRVPQGAAVPPPRA